MISNHLERIYTELQRSPYPVFIWGAGSMSEEIISRLEERGISYAGRFITTEAENSHIIPSDEVIFSLKELEMQHEKINIVAGHGHYEKITDLKPYSFINKVYVIPNPYLQYKGPDLEYVCQNQDRLNEIIGQLADVESQQALERYIAVSITNDISYLLYPDICVDGMFGLKELNITDSESFVDVGAWEGDTISRFLKCTDNKFRKIFAFEPDPNIFKVLHNRYGNHENISLYHCGLGERNGELCIGRENTQSAFLTSADGSPASEKIPIKTLDDVLAEETVSLLKISVPFMFLDILKGSRNLLQKNRPRLIINVAADDRFLLYDTVKWITDLNLPYKLVLRFDFPMPTRLCLYAYPATL
jgi:FkbM family methyltransferase